MEECECQASEASDGECGGQAVYGLGGAGMAQPEVDACDAGVVDLLEELSECGAALVVDPCCGEEPASCAAFDESVREVDVLAEAHLRESSQTVVDVAADAHVVRPGVELVEPWSVLPFPVASAYASCGEERRHAVVDGFLYGCEPEVCAVGSSEGFARGFAVESVGVEGLGNAFDVFVGER